MQETKPKEKESEDFKRRVTKPLFAPETKEQKPKEDGRDRNKDKKAL